LACDRVSVGAYLHILRAEDSAAVESLFSFLSGG